ncbi:hypothetical protein BTO06_11885 [Tenacibaculum sp. SZ-18]|uniref:hypothetical protein n=1 Tax=Tenacibaculum sp. SZ-18 TaxID=754423 RepID=UPI000C2D171E|nr:hypothetical protein [Tenacibaculum sp. SZ-18]AUC15805.1 hypothetical protein BTO06_11885 [Tenacibaculum sp. SZ-18]
MNIISANLNFILLDVIDQKNSSGLKLKLTHTNHFPRKLKPKEFKNFELKLIGIEKKTKLKTELKKFTDNYLDIEEIENGILDFWSDSYQIGEFKVDSFVENVSELTKEDWIDNYQNLLNFYYKQNDEKTKESILQTKFLDRLKKLTEEEIKKYERKSEFFKDDEDKINALNERMNLANRIEQIRQQFISELKNIE